mmetsp:Transcript_37358/g.89478  ORF Transcript_37358/g.89478 Transcript_37358/m.89478 type:complete len:244 (+) Transcript_37358:3564-4295(+)
MAQVDTVEYPSDNGHGVLVLEFGMVAEELQTWVIVEQLLDVRKEVVPRQVIRARLPEQVEEPLVPVVRGHELCPVAAEYPVGDDGARREAGGPDQIRPQLQYPRVQRLVEEGRETAYLLRQPLESLEGDVPAVVGRVVVHLRLGRKIFAEYWGELRGGLRLGQQLTEEQVGLDRDAGPRLLARLGCAVVDAVPRLIRGERAPHPPQRNGGRRSILGILVAPALPVEGGYLELRRLVAPGRPCG